MAAKPQFALVLDEGTGGDAELKYDVEATHLTNEEQQKILIDAEVTGKMVVLVDMETVVHGTLSQGGTPATLIVLRFQFLPGRSGKRFKSAEIKIIFSKGSNASSTPEVYKISPEGKWGVEPTDVKLGSSHTISPSLQAGNDLAKGTVGYQYQFTKNYDTKVFARVEGAKRALGGVHSVKNSAVWNVYENPVTRHGIPSLLQTAILVTREKVEGQSTGERFKATLEIHGQPGWKGRLKEKIEKIGAAIGSAFAKLTGHGKKEDEGDDDDDEDLDMVSRKAEMEEGVIFNPGLSRGDTKHAEELEIEDLNALKQVVMIQEDKDEQKGG
jgi:hypothetical protein